MAKDALVQELVDGFDDWPAQPRPEEPASAGSCGGAARMTSELYPYDALFSPIRVNRLTLKNRIVMAPMGNIDMCEETGRPNQKMLDYFFARAKGGCGLITTGLVPVSHGIDATVTEPGGLTYFPRIDRSRTVMAGWRDLAQGVHAFGSRIFVQLTAGLGRVGNPQCLLTLKRFPASASLLPNYYMPSVPCMRLSDRRLGHIVRALGQAAADASAMGLDGVYLHGHEGYLLEQMANPAFNHRRLGRYADWRRFGLDAVREIRRRVGPDLPIMYRIDLSLALEETYGEEVLDGTYLGRMRGGRSVEQTLGYMEELVAAGVDLFDVDLGCYDNWWMPHPPASMPAGCFVPVAEAVKRRFARDCVKSNAGRQAGLPRRGRARPARGRLRHGDAGTSPAGRSRVAQQGLCGPCRPDQAVHRLPGGLRERVRGGRPPAMRGQPPLLLRARHAGGPAARRLATPRGRGGGRSRGHGVRARGGAPRARGHAHGRVRRAGRKAALRRCRPDEVRRGELPLLPRGAAARRGARGRPRRGARAPRWRGGACGRLL